ncbi:MAG: hypothetical protein K9N01_13250 [Cephaloticoccus sp.]|nr:hypothetical protein [Cephaloticoccus sp.]
MVSAFLSALAEEGTNQAQFAERCGVAPANISRFIKGSKPEDLLFSLLCTKWQNPDLGRQVLLGHLLDEIARSGRPSGEVTFNESEVSGDELLENSLVMIRREALLDGVVRDHVVSLGRLAIKLMVRRSRKPS